MNKYAGYFKLEKQMHSAGFMQTRAELIDKFTNGRKSSLKSLEHIQYTEFLAWIRATFQIGGNSKDQWKNSPANKKRQKLFVIFCKEMNYTKNQYEEWVIKYGQFHKPIEDHTSEELSLLIVQAQKVLASYTKAINK